MIIMTIVHLEILVIDYTLQCSNMMLVESIPKEPLCFQLIRFDNQKISYTIQVSYLIFKHMLICTYVVEDNTTPYFVFRCT